MTLQWFCQSVSKYQALFDLWQNLSGHKLLVTMTKPIDHSHGRFKVGGELLLLTAMQLVLCSSQLSVVSAMCVLWGQQSTGYRQWHDDLICQFQTLINKLNCSTVAHSLLLQFPVLSFFCSWLQVGSSLPELDIEYLHRSQSSRSFTLHRCLVTIVVLLHVHLWICSW